MDDLTVPPAEDLNDGEIDLDAESGIGTLRTQSESKVEMDGTFTVENLSPGKYWFSTDLPNDNEYFKQIICDEKDFTTQPIEITVGTSMDCKIILGANAAKITGKVMEDDKPVSGYVVVAIPEPLPLRKVPYFLDDVGTSSSGEFRFTGIAPGDYLLFAVPSDHQQGYYAPDFADRNQRDAVRVTVAAGETKTLTLKPTNPM